MSTVVSTILICSPLAFVCGWLVSKAALRQTHASTASTPTVPAASTPQYFDPNATIQRPDGRTLLAMALETTEDSSATPRAEDTDKTTLQKELRLIREAVAERDHEISELKKSLQDQPDIAALGITGYSTANNDEAVTTLTQELADVQHEKLLLSGQLHSAEAFADGKSRHMVSWRNRIKPLVQQCRQQRIIITELRNELRNSLNNSPTEGIEESPLMVDVPADDLKVLRGIGPALEKRLNQQGIFCYRQLAAMTEDELTIVCQSLGIGRHRTLSGEWLEQAQALISENTSSSAPADIDAQETPQPA
jgi:predicted flap endonuclease-1-like 5' DNA nuclease